MEINREMYGVEVTEWETSGSCDTVCICKDMKTAVLIQEALKRVFPTTINVTRGDSKEIHRRVEIKVAPLFTDDVKNFVRG